MLFKQEGWAQQKGKVYIKRPILREGLDKNDYFWNRDALESLGRDWAGMEKSVKVEYRDTQSMPHEVGIVYNLELTDLELPHDGYLIAYIELDESLLKGLGLDPAKAGEIKFAACVAVDYKLDKVESFNDLAFDIDMPDVPAEKYEVYKLKELEGITVDSLIAPRALIYVNGKKQKFVTEIVNHGDTYEVTLRLPKESVEVRLKKE